MPQDPPHCTPDLYGQTGAGGRGQKCVLVHSTHAPVLVLQPWANQLCKRGAELVPPENMTPAVCPTWEACLHCQLGKCCSRHDRGLPTFWSPTRRAVPKYVLHSFCSIKSPSMSDLFSMQVVFAQLGKYWTSKFFLGNKFPLKSMRQASHLFLWLFLYIKQLYERKIFQLCLEASTLQYAAARSQIKHKNEWTELQACTFPYTIVAIISKLTF